VLFACALAVPCMAPCGPHHPNLTVICCAARALDKYFELRQAVEGPATAAGAPTPEVTIDARLEAIVERMLARCVADKQYEQVRFRVWSAMC
jgi:DNA-binding GntR family transcriptional regulator